jgi:hypothetical protein
MALNRFVIGALTVLVAAALLVLLAAACGGGGDGGDTSQDSDTPQADDSQDDDDGDGDGGDDSVLADLAGLAGEAAEGVTAKVTYSIMTEADGETFEGEWVLVQRPPDSRFEISGSEGGEEFRSIIINAGGKAYLCTSIAGAETCLATTAEETGAEASPLDPLFDVPREIAEDVTDVGLVNKSERKIAGVDATCFSISGGLSSLGDGEVCFSEGGLLLLMRSDIDGVTSSFEATSVSTDVTDADFEPPYDILELPEFEIPTPP